MQIEMWSIERIKEYDRNPRDNEAAVGPVAESIRQFGFRFPVLVDKDGVLIAGHTRVRAARKLGMTEVPVIRAEDLTPQQVQALRVADNKLHELASWDVDLLPVELRDLQVSNFDLSALGFDQEELARLLDPGVQAGLTDPDDVPAPPDEAVSKPGDLWILGNHRLLCGDSASAVDVDRLLGGARIQLCNSDPPYNVSLAPRSNNAIAVYGDHPIGQQGMDMAIRGKTHATTEKMRPKDRPLANDFVSDEEFARLLRAWFGNVARVLEPGRSFYLWGGYSNLGNYPPALAESGLYFSQCVVWDKQHPVLTRKDMMSTCELAFYGWREGAAHKFFGPPNATDLWHIKKIPPQLMEHLTAKPVELAVRAIQYSSLSGESVLDLFGGSGSTLIACEQTGRRAFLMEIDPLYADLIADRFQRFTGRLAVLERTSASPIPMKPREESMR